MEKKSCEFTYQHYWEILTLAKDKGYQFRFFQHPVSSSSSDIIYLRHDVEMLPEVALQLAHIERKLDVQATYCFLARTIFYNLFSDEIAQAVSEIRSLGHQIALHFDTGIYSTKATANADELLCLVQKEISLVEVFFDQKVDIVSFHNPPKFVFNREFPGFINTYQSAFFSNIKYLSDSNMQWREGCLCQVLGEKRYSRMQILTHPLFWQEEVGSLVERFRWSLDYRLGRMENQIVNSNQSLRCRRDMLRGRVRNGIL